MGKVTTLFGDTAKTEELYPRTKVSAVSDANDKSLEEIIDDLTLTGGTGIDITNGTISNVFSTMSAPNLDDIKYNYQGFVTQCTNMPSGVNYNGELIVVGRQTGTQYFVQLYSPYNANALYMRKYNSSWGDWVRLTECYMAGDTVTFTNTTDAPGVITSSQKQIIFSIPLDRPCNATRVSFTKLNLLIRGINGYVIGSSQTDVIADSNYSVSAFLNGNGIYVSVTCTNAVTTTNNTPITVEVRNGTSFTFS